MQTAGLVLDLYDNPMDLKTIFPSVDVIPDTIKVAHCLSAEEREQLPDTSFALVLMNGVDRLRKYACIDQGNTELSIAYFFKHGHKLPLEAQKTAAANLAKACSWYGIPAKEELEKVALLGLLMAPSIIKGTAGQIRDNLAATQAGGGAIMTPHQQQHLGAMMKGAELTGTHVMPQQDPGRLESVTERKPAATLTSVAKTATTGHLVKGHGSTEDAVVLSDQQPVHGEQASPAAAPRLDLKPHVDVTNKKPPLRLVAKEAEHYAYRDMYPLDNYAQVKQASVYFDEQVVRMPPEMRHEFAVNLVKRASLMGVAVSDQAREYGSETFAPFDQIKVAMDTRRPHLTEKQAAVLDRLLDHRAELGPVRFSETLAEFDKLAEIDWMYDRAVMDPYASTFGLQKTAEDHGDSWINGNDYVTKKMLENYAVTAALSLSDAYGADFSKEFRKDPWGIFNSLPVDQKRRLARSASDNSATGMHDVA